MEQEEYGKEEINWSYIEFVDNQDVLDLIEKVYIYCFIFNFYLAFRRMVVNYNGHLVLELCFNKLFDTNKMALPAYSRIHIIIILEIMVLDKMKR